MQQTFILRQPVIEAEAAQDSIVQLMHGSRSLRPFERQESWIVKPLG